MDYLEEVTTRVYAISVLCSSADVNPTGQADIILANSMFTARVFKAHFPSIGETPTVVYPGINLAAYEATSVDPNDPDVVQVARCVSVVSRRLSIDLTAKLVIDQRFCP